MCACQAVGPAWREPDEELAVPWSPPRFGLCFSKTTSQVLQVWAVAGSVTHEHSVTRTRTHLCPPSAVLHGPRPAQGLAAGSDPRAGGSCAPCRALRSRALGLGSCFRPAAFLPLASRSSWCPPHLCPAGRRPPCSLLQSPAAHPGQGQSGHWGVPVSLPRVASCTSLGRTRPPSSDLRPPRGGTKPLPGRPFSSQMAVLCSQQTVRWGWGACRALALVVTLARAQGQ